MTFKEAWIEALRRAGAPESFLEQERQRNSKDMKLLDKELKFRPGVTQEEFISEMAEILSSRVKSKAFAAWAEWEKDRDLRRN